MAFTSQTADFSSVGAGSSWLSSATSEIIICLPSQCKYSSSALHSWESNLRAHSGITCRLAAPGREASLCQPCSAHPWAPPAHVRHREPSQPLCTLFPSPSPTLTSPGPPPLVFPLLLIGQFGELICAIECGQVGLEKRNAHRSMYIWKNRKTMDFL